MQEMEMNALVKAGIFPSKTEVVKEALRLLFATRPQLNVEATGSTVQRRGDHPGACR